MTDRRSFLLHTFVCAPNAESRRKTLKAKGIKVPSKVQVEKRKEELKATPAEPKERKGPPPSVAAKKGGKKA